MHFRWLVLLLIGTGMMLGCGKKERIDVDRKGNIKLRGEKPVSLKGKGKGDLLQKGTASWYGRPYHGRKTSNGERYNMNKLTAAHKTIPFGTVVEVVNLDNGRRVKVRINDRGPFVRGRIIDLSRKAAKQIGVFESGIAKVELYLKEAPRDVVVARPAVRPKPAPKPVATKPEPPPPAEEEIPDDDILEPESDPLPEPGSPPEDLKEPTPTPPVTNEPVAAGNGHWTIQVGSFSEKQRAQALARRMGAFSNTVVVTPGGGLWRVRVGRFLSKKEAQDLARLIADDAIKPWVVFAEGTK